MFEPELALRLVDRAGLILGHPEEQKAEVEAHRRRLRKAPRERAEPGEGLRRATLVKASDRGCNLRVGVAGCAPGGGVVLAPGRDPVAEPLESEAVEELRAGIVPTGASLERRELGRWLEAGEPGR